MRIEKDIFLKADRKKQIEYIWDKLEEIHIYVKNDKKKRYAITAASGFVGGVSTMVIIQFKMLWERVIGG